MLRAPLDDGTAPSAHFMPSHTYQLAPPAAVREPGWAGIALSRQQADLVATATHFDRELVVYEGQVPLRTLGLAASPTSVMFLPSSFPGCSSGSVIAATHGQNVRPSPPRPLAAACMLVSPPAPCSVDISPAYRDRDPLLLHPVPTAHMAPDLQHSGAQSSHADWSPGLRHSVLAQCRR